MASSVYGGIDHCSTDIEFALKHHLILVFQEHEIWRILVQKYLTKIQICYSVDTNRLIDKRQAYLSQLIMSIVCCVNDNFLQPDGNDWNFLDAIDAD